MDQFKGDSTSFAFQEAVSMEGSASASIASQAMSWPDLWSMAVGKISETAFSKDSKECSAFFRLLQSGGMTISFLTHLMVNMWTNWLLKRRDSALSRVSRYISPEAMLALKNGTLLETSSIFPKDQVQATIDRRRADNNGRLVLQAVSLLGSSYEWKIG